MCLLKTMNIDSEFREGNGNPLQDSCTPVFLAGKSHGQRSLAGYSPWGSQTVRRELVTKQQSK